MKAATISEIKSSLQNQSSSELVDLCLRLARFKKENKELLTYLLFEAGDVESYIASVKQDISDEFEGITNENLYFAKKSFRRILRMTNKHIRYTGSREAEAALLIHFCREMKASSIRYTKSPQLVNLYLGQLKKARAAIATMHEDLQYEYERAVERLMD